MTQARKGSMIEAMFNVLIGFGINLCANSLIFPLFGWDLSLHDNMFMGLFYTAISIARQYCIRRWFNRLIRRVAA